ncbi:MAG TPA: serine/threonine-protein kinase [Thermoanaerobaculia bacterium]
MTTFWEEVRTLFQAAAATPRDRRAELLESATPEVREEVESLLAAHDDESPFLSRSVWEIIESQQGQLLDGMLIGPYRVIRQLGEGGMGTVLLAVREHAEFAQRVAIKLVRGGEVLLQRFRQERQILAGLEHPNIARLIDGGTTADGLPYLVMEYVEGTPIDEYCRACSTPDKLRLFLQLCDAVQYAHRSLIIHRDIKPPNVLVTADGTPKLLDFGIAKLVSQTEETSTRVMTPDYASPEQLMGRAITTSADVFSLGVLLFELLTGQKPFDASRTPLTEAPRGSLRGDLEAIVAAALEVDPARRYATVDKLADDIRRHLTGHPIAARRATFRYHAMKFVRRNLLAVAAAVAIVIVTAIAFAATLHQKRIAERRFDEVRSLARAVVFELHDAIAPLPGSTAARELLVRRALVYLDNLEAESRDNTQLEMELAGAYIKVGDVQGLPYRANLGDTAGALASYRKALRIAQEVAAREGEEDVAARTLLADAHDRLGMVEQRLLHWSIAMEHHETARAIREALPRTPRRDLALAETWTAIGDCRYVGEPYKPKPRMRGTAQQAYESSLATLVHMQPAPELRRAVLRELGRSHQRLGGFFSGTKVRDLPRAIRHHEAAQRVLGELLALDPADAVARRNYADQLGMTATAHNAREDGARALAATERALPILHELAAADPRNTEAQHDLAFAYGEEGIALMYLRRFDDADAAFDQAIAIRKRLIAADPSNGEERRDLARIEQYKREVQIRRNDKS